MRKFFLAVFMLILGATLPFTATAKTSGKVLFIDAYHEGYEWSDGITAGVKKGLQGAEVELKIVRMDTKRNPDEEFKKKAGQAVKKEIDAFKPAVVISADDNPAIYVIVPYYKDSAIPFVFCGINWDASIYGFPCKNVTGMLEVTPVPQLLSQLKPFAKGKRVGKIGPDNETNRKESENYRKHFDFSLVDYFAKDVEDWKKGFLEIQEKVDILILDSDGGLYKDKAEELRAFVEANTKIPTGSSYDFMAPFAMINFAKVAEEQGFWAAQTAIQILNGKAPSTIPMTQNKEGKLIINTRIARSIGAKIPYEVLGLADKVIK
ncbi:MAG: hypothetical protein C4519_11935 [Desulfobacteraceae bacterium]|nr:MAG: hypothetical protein C4519_11935 [Desulfobacteraceae bacterium]